MARFRSLLVHVYARVDGTKAHGVIRKRLGDFEQYLARVGHPAGR